MRAALLVAAVAIGAVVPRASADVPRDDGGAFAALRAALAEARDEIRRGSASRSGLRRLEALRRATVAVRGAGRDLGRDLAAARRAFLALDGRRPGIRPNGPVADARLAVMASLVLRVATSTTAVAELAAVEPDAIRRSAADAAVAAAGVSRAAALAEDGPATAISLLARADRQNRIAAGLLATHGSFRGDVSGFACARSEYAASASADANGLVTIGAGSIGCGAVADGDWISFRFADSGPGARGAAATVWSETGHTVRNWSNPTAFVVVGIDDPRTGVLVVSVNCDLVPDDGGGGIVTIRNGRFVVRRAVP